MSDLTNKPKPHHGPVYAAAMYPGWAAIAREHGYALAVHGSLARDLDLIAIPWTEDASEPQAVVDAILAKYAVDVIGEWDDNKPHGRRALTLNIGFGSCSADLQFMPRHTVPAQQADTPAPALDLDAMEARAKAVREWFASKPYAFPADSVNLLAADVLALTARVRALKTDRDTFHQMWVDEDDTRGIYQRRAEAAEARVRELEAATHCGPCHGDGVHSSATVCSWHYQEALRALAETEDRAEQVEGGPVDAEL